MATPKLHELLAVEKSLKTQADLTRGELTNTFEKKKHHFSKKTVIFKSVDADVPDEQEDQLDLQTTIPKELKWISEKLAGAMDVSFKVAEGNMQARADVVLKNGKIILTAVPATALLELEKRVAEVMLLVKAIPTLDPAKGFVLDENEGAGVYRARIEKKPRTRKVQKVLTLAQATDKHPAQAQVISVDEKSGDVVTQEWSGLITTAAKGDMLDRVEDLKRAVKSALSRANAIEVTSDREVGKELLSFVFGS
jgi:hypothetical protein